MLYLNHNSYNLQHSPVIFTNNKIGLNHSPEQLYDCLNIDSLKQAKLRIDNVADYIINNGNTVKYHFYDRKLSFIDQLHSVVTGLILLQREHLLLHGNSFQFRNKLIALCGESGAGKSSLAAQFHKNGSLFFCDEIICFDKDTNNILPGFPFLRLWNDDTIHFSTVSKLWDNEEKYKLDTSSQCLTQKQHLNSLIFIEASDQATQVEIRQLKGVEKLKTFWASYYHLPVMKAMNLLTNFQEESVKIVPNLKIFKLVRPIKNDTRQQCYDLVKSTLEQTYN